MMCTKINKSTSLVNQNSKIIIIHYSICFCPTLYFAREYIVYSHTHLHTHIVCTIMDTKGSTKKNKNNNNN